MNNKDDIIAQGALTQFAKFGLRKTTMQDVADEAGISRQTLYNRVPNKDALLRLVAKYYFDDNIGRCRHTLDNCTDMASAWDVLIQHFIIEVWQTVNAMPEAEAFEMSANQVISEEVAYAAKQKIALIAQTISTFSVTDHSHSPEDIGRFFCAVAMGIKHTATDEASLMALTGTLKDTLIRLGGTASAS
jgi:AcrR family transcriptional regulator